MDITNSGHTERHGVQRLKINRFQRSRWFEHIMRIGTTVSQNTSRYGGSRTRSIRFLRISWRSHRQGTGPDRNSCLHCANKKNKL